MTGCDRCGHRKREHDIVSGKTEGVRLCSAVVRRRATVDGYDRRCMCPKYLAPGTMR